MDVETAIRTRRTHKQYGPEPIDRATLEELLDLARFVPNHHLSQPWRFRVLGPETLARLKDAAGPKEAAKLDRAPTLLAGSAALTGDPPQDEEDLHAPACAPPPGPLRATPPGLASSWRPPAALRDPAIYSLVDIGAAERFVALLHLGPRLSHPPPKEREPLASRLTFL